MKMVEEWGPRALSEASRHRATIRGLLFTVLALAALGAASAAEAAETFVAGQTYYAIGVPVCKAAKHAKVSRCFAMRRELVAQGTQGALPFLPGAGASGVSTIGPKGGLTPADLLAAYGFPSSGGGQQTVAIVDAYNDPNIEADLQVFDQQYSLKTCTIKNKCLKVVSQTGSTKKLAPDDTTGWSVEESLDVETVHSVCPDCKILLVEANSNSNADLGTAENEAVALGATVVSNSFGGPEGSADATFEAAFNHPGVVIVVSSADDGYYFFDYWEGINQPSFPASSPYVVAVGGTSLYLGQSGGRQYETVWNDNGVQDYFEKTFGYRFGASGGGCSTMFNAPKWQTKVAGWKNTACGSMRLSTDVAAVADYLTGLDIYDSYNCGSSCYPAPGWFTIGGTSLAAPVISAAFALAGGANGVDYPASTLYGNMGKGYDVTVGGNGWCDGESPAECGNPNTLGLGLVDCGYSASGSVQAGGACDAQVGFDGPSGIGTPNGLTIFTKGNPKGQRAGLN